MPKTVWEQLEHARKLEAAMSPYDRATGRRVAAYGIDCPYCGALRGESCKAKNKRDAYTKVPHLHRIMAMERPIVLRKKDGN